MMRWLSLIGGGSAIVLLGCSTAISIQNNRAQNNAYQWTAHTTKVMMKAHELALAISDTERAAGDSMMRGGSTPDFIKRSGEARHELDDLKKLTSDNHEQQLRWGRVTRNVELQQTLFARALAKPFDPDSRDAMMQARLLQGVTIDEIGIAIDVENELFVKRQAVFKETSKNMGLTLVFVALLALVLILIATRSLIIGSRAKRLAEIAEAREAEIHERIAVEEQLREALDRQKLLLDELNHRVKNSLATVQSIAVQTKNAAISQLKLADHPKTLEDLNRYFAAFEARLMTLSATHNLLVMGSWTGVSLEQAISAALMPLVSPERSTFSGPEICLSPNAAVTLNMIFHELSTNAIKYGAMVNKTGAVAVTWELEGDKLSICWKERGGPPPVPPTSFGFGTKLIERGIGRELRGQHAIAFPEDGFCCTLTLPLSEHIYIKN